MQCSCGRQCADQGELVHHMLNPPRASFSGKKRGNYQIHRHEDANVMMEFNKKRRIESVRQAANRSVWPDRQVVIDASEEHVELADAFIREAKAFHAAARNAKQPARMPGLGEVIKNCDVAMLQRMLARIRSA